MRCFKTYLGAVAALIALTACGGGSNGATAVESTAPAAPTTTAAAPTTTVAATTSTTAGPVILNGKLTMSGGRGAGLVRRNDTIGGDCGAKVDGALEMASSGVVTVKDRAGKIIGDGQTTVGSLKAVSSNADGSLIRQTCSVNVILKMYEAAADLSIVSVEFERSSVKVEVRVTQIAEGFDWSVDL